MPGDIHRAPEGLATLVALEGALDTVNVLQVFHQLRHVKETGTALAALVDRSLPRFTSSAPEMEKDVLRYTVRT